MKQKLKENLNGNKPSGTSALAEFDKLPVAKAPSGDSVSQFLAKLDE